MQGEGDRAKYDRVWETSLVSCFQRDLISVEEIEKSRPVKAQVLLESRSPTVLLYSSFFSGESLMSGNCARGEQNEYEWTS